MKQKKLKTPDRRARRKSLNKQCEDTWKELVKRVGCCLRCGRGKNEVVLNAAHVYPKGEYRNHPIKWDVQNGVCLCYRCHIHWAHKNPIDFTEWFQEKFPERWTYLHEQVKEIKKIDFEKTLSGLKKLAELK